MTAPQIVQATLVCFLVLVAVGVLAAIIAWLRGNPIAKSSYWLGLGIAIILAFAKDLAADPASARGAATVLILGSVAIIVTRLIKRRQPLYDQLVIVSCALYSAVAFAQGSLIFVTAFCTLSIVVLLVATIRVIGAAVAMRPASSPT